MSGETAELLEINSRFVKSEYALKINRISSIQLENLLHIQAILVAYFYRFDGENTQWMDVYAPCLLSTLRRFSRISLAVPVKGSIKLAEIKTELNEHFANVASGLASITSFSGETHGGPHPGDKLLVFYDADYPIEDWIQKNHIADITVLCAFGAEDISISFRSRYDSIDEASLDRFRKNFYQFAQSAELEGDQIAVAEVDLITAEDIDLRARVSPDHEESNSFELPHRIVEHLSATFPNRTALKFGSQSIDYETLNERANRFAHYLKNEGVDKGSRCVVLIKPSFDTIVAMLSVFKIGAVYVPVDYEYPAERIKYVIQDSNPSAILCTSETAAFLHGDDRKINVDEFKSQLNEFSSVNLQESASADDEAYVFYTSGTTGKPKGVVGSYRNLYHYVSVAKRKFGMGPDTIMPVVAKSSFSISFFETLTPLVSGGSCVLLPRSDVLDVNRMIDVLRNVTMFHIGPSLLSRILRKVKQDEPFAGFPNVVHASTGGDMVPVELLNDMSRLFAGAEVFVIYGSSEIACMGCSYLLNRWDMPAKTFVGKAFPGMQVDIVDADMNVLPVGWKGEICFVGDGVTLGYQNNAELTGTKFFDRNGRRGFRTGDVGRLDRGGNIEMLGRSDFQIKINGIRVELAEIDYYLKKSPHVAEIISKAFQTEDGNTVIYACVVGDLTMPQVSDIRRFLAENLPEYMHPKGFIRIEKMPLNQNMKVDRKALPNPSTANLIRESTYVAAETETENRLTKIWEDILKTRPVGIDDDFFASGGTSLQGIDLLVTIEQELKRTISVNDFMQARTIRDLARYVDGLESGCKKSGSVIELKKGMPDKALFFIHDGEGDVFPYFSLSQMLGTDWSVFGIAPRAQGHAKISDTTFEAMVDSYVSEIRRIKPQGPYLLGGLCVGGFLAYCVGCKLQDLGDRVSHIFLFDAHHIDAKPIEGREGSERNERLKQAIAHAEHRFASLRALEMLKVVASKGRGYLIYTLKLRMGSVKKKIQMFLLKNVSVEGWLIKVCAPDVDTVIRNAESNFRQRPRFVGSVTLFRATRKLNVLDALHIDDTPYCEIFADEGLGWPGKFDGNLVIHDIAAGHSTLLTPPYVNEIAGEISRNG